MKYVVVRRYLDVRGETAFEGHGQPEVVLHLGIVNAVHLAKHVYHLFRAEIHDLVYEVHSPVEHHTAAERFCAAPALGHTAAALDSRFYYVRLADKSLSDHTLHQDVILVEAPVLIDSEDLSGFFGCRHDLFELCMADRDRLFAKDMLAGSERFLAELCVSGVVCGNKHDVYFVVAEQGFERGIGLQPLVSRRLHTFLVYVMV